MTITLFIKRGGFPRPAEYLLDEEGDYFITESGDRILLE